MKIIIIINIKCAKRILFLENASNMHILGRIVNPKYAKTLILEKCTHYLC